MTTTYERPDAVETAPLPVALAVPAASVRGADRPRVISGRTSEDWSSLLGAGLASLATSWLLYEQVLPFSGKLGFLLVWYAMFLGLYGLVTAVSNPRPVVVDRLMAAVITGGVAIVGLALVTVLLYVLAKGFPAYRHLSFFTQDGSKVGPTTGLAVGGVRHAIIGSIEEVAIAVVISLPLGVITAVYLTEARGRLPRMVRTVIEAMTALPDLVAGLFVYAFLVIALGQERDGFACALALSITMIPIIARSSEVALRVVPGGLREASLALGASRWRTAASVVLPTARTGLATALILGIARGVGETAPLLIVSGESNFTNLNPGHNPMNSLPLYIYKGLRSGQPLLISRGFGAAAVLLALVVVLFVVVRVLARRRVGRS